MKLSNDLVIFDLETSDDKKRHIIEIGAAYVTKDLEIKSIFDVVMRPPEPISPFVEILCKLSNEYLQSDGVDPAVGLQQFEKWVALHSPNTKKPRLCAWGNYFDIPVLRNEFERQGYAGYEKYPFAGSAYDVKSIAYVWCAMAGKKNDELGVQTVYEDYMGFPPPGHYHRAYVDAEATAKIFIRAMKDLSSGMWLDGKRLKVVLE